MGASAGPAEGAGHLRGREREEVMARPAGGYKLKDGTRVPGNTTICELWGANKRQLMWWANKMGLEGKTLEDAQKLEAEAGTLIHTLVEAELRSLPTTTIVIPPELKDKVENGLLGFYEWRDSSKLEVTHSELSLVSEKHRFGTTIDFPSRVNGRRRNVELKTADGLYETFLIQSAAQGAAWDETFPEDPVDGYVILRFGKADGSFHETFFPRGAPKMSAAWESFLHLRSLYDLARVLK